MSSHHLAIGIGLIVLGLVVYVIGIMFFLDRAMLAIGNVRMSAS